MNLFNYTFNITRMQQNDKNLQLLAKRIKALRQAQCSSLNKFVFSKGSISSATWSRIENGLVDVKFNTLIKVAALLNISITDLLKDINFDYTLKEE